jgi:hypothetical protein
LILFPPFPFLILLVKGTRNPLANTINYSITRGCSPSLIFVPRGTIFQGNGRGKEGQVQTIIATELYIDYGFFSGLAAMSEMRELLDELYGNLC